MVSAFYPLFFVVLIKIRETIFWLHPIFGLFDRFLILFFYAQNLHGVQRGDFICFVTQTVI